AYAVGSTMENPSLTEILTDETDAQDQGSHDKSEEERQKQREESLKKELGDLFVPLPSLENRVPNPPVKAKGLYLTGHSVGLKTRYDNILKLLDSTELNALVIDVKDDHGRITYNSEIEYVKKIDSQYLPPPISDIKEILNELNQKDIYPIARIVVFKDPFFAEKRHDLAIQRSDRQGMWRNNKGVAWVNPYMKEVWDYNIAIAKEVALLGFREIQFDYVRFPEGARFIENEVHYPDNNGIAKDDIVAEFVKYAGKQLEDYDVHLAVDVFGVISSSWGDPDLIGQTWENIAPYTDYICPMIYPSHYGRGYFGFAVPDALPGETVREALTDSIKRNAQIETPPIIRPWLQGFTATWIDGHIPYGANEVRLQIDTALKLDLDEYLIWNAGNVYPEGAFLPKIKAEERIREIKLSKEKKHLDALGRSPQDAAEIYLDALNRGDWREVYAIQGTGFKLDPEIIRRRVGSRNIKINGAAVAIDGGLNNDTTRLIINLEVSIGGRNKKLIDEQWRAVMENNVWKIIPSDLFLNIMAQAQD
ncbi:MAG: putative glycoside hydrolase, partial [Dethiobacteria bacterium]